MLDRSELNWLFFGFRLGQLLEICRINSLRDGDDIPLIDQLLLKLKAALCRCDTHDRDKDQLLQIHSSMEDTWRQYDVLSSEFGTEKPIEMIRRELLQLVQFFRENYQRRPWNWFEVGTLLGQSYGLFDDSVGFPFPDNSKRKYWNYRNKPDLELRTDALGVTIEKFSGLPEDSITFYANQTGPDAPPTMLRYPGLRFGWGFIEDRLESLIAQAPISTNEPSAVPVVTQSEEATHPVSVGGLATISVAAATGVDRPAESKGEPNDIPVANVPGTETPPVQTPVLPNIQESSPSAETNDARLPETTPVAETPAPPVKNELNPGYLGLIVDVANKRTPIRRDGCEGNVELTAERLWRLFLKYWQSGQKYVTKATLDKSWGEIGNETKPAPNFASSANSELRRKLKVLKIDVVLRPKNDDTGEDSAWRLEDTSHKDADVDE